MLLVEILKAGNAPPIRLASKRVGANRSGVLRADDYSGLRTRVGLLQNKELFRCAIRSDRDFDACRRRTWRTDADFSASAPMNLIKKVDVGDLDGRFGGGNRGANWISGCYRIFGPFKGIWWRFRQLPRWRRRIGNWRHDSL